MFSTQVIFYTSVVWQIYNKILKWCTQMCKQFLYFFTFSYLESSHNVPTLEWDSHPGFGGVKITFIIIIFIHY